MDWPNWGEPTALMVAFSIGNVGWPPSPVAHCVRAFDVPWSQLVTTIVLRIMIIATLTDSSNNDDGSIENESIENNNDNNSDRADHDNSKNGNDDNE